MRPSAKAIGVSEPPSWTDVPGEAGKEDGSVHNQVGGPIQYLPGIGEGVSMHVREHAKQGVCFPVLLAVILQTKCLRLFPF